MSDMRDTFNRASHQGPTSFVIPTIIEDGPKGRVSYDPYSRLLKDRVIKIEGPINDQTASIVTSLMLILDETPPEPGQDSDIKLYINSPGGSVTAGMAIFDTMKSLKSDVVTVGMGMCASMASFLLAAGTKGKRFALPNTRIMTHQPSAGTQGQVTDMEIHVDEFKRTKVKMRAYYEHFLNIKDKDFESIYERDTFFNTLAGQKLGHIDHIVLKGPDQQDNLSADEKELLALEIKLMEEENKTHPVIAPLLEKLEKPAATKKSPASKRAPR